MDFEPDRRSWPLLGAASKSSSETSVSYRKISGSGLGAEPQGLQEYFKRILDAPLSVC
jgi:hypothetical protein